MIDKTKTENKIGTIYLVNDEGIDLFTSSSSFLIPTSTFPIDLDCFEVRANLDDERPEVMAYVQQKLLDLGVLDVWLTPIHMKKGRSGVMIEYLVSPLLLHQSVHLLFNETAAIGLRFQPAYRIKLNRQFISVPTAFGDVQVKIAYSPSPTLEILNTKPEYEDCARLARQAKVPLVKVYQEALQWCTLHSQTILNTLSS